MLHTFSLTFRKKPQIPRFNPRKPVNKFDSLQSMQLVGLASSWARLYMVEQFIIFPEHRVNTIGFVSNAFDKCILIWCKSIRFNTVDIVDYLYSIAFLATDAMSMTYYYLDG